MSSINHIVKLIKDKMFVELKVLLRDIEDDDDPKLYISMFYMIYKDVNTDILDDVFQDRDIDGMVNYLYRFIEYNIHKIRELLNNQTITVKDLREQLFKYLIYDNINIEDLIEWYIQRQQYYN